MKQLPIWKRRLWLLVSAVGCMLGSAVAAGQALPQVNSIADAQRLSASVADKHGILTSADNTCLFYRYWPATDRASIERVVIVLHGIGYESGPYKVIADALNPQGIDVYAEDARAHGLSCGRRGYIATPVQAADDVSSIVHWVKNERPSAKIYLLGESMGGAFALNYIRKNNNQISGLILLAPAIGVNGHQIFKVENLALLPYLLFAHRSPAISLVGKRLDESSRDASFIAERRVDPLAYKRVSFGYLWDIQHLVKNWKSEIAPGFSVPTVIVQGGKDVIVSHKDCEILARTKAANNRQYKVFPDALHTTLWDPDTPDILRFVSRWIMEH